MQKIMEKRKLRGRAVATIVIIICVAVTVTVYFVLRMFNMLPNVVQNSSSNRSSLNGSSLISSSKPVFSAVDLSLLLLVNKDNIIPPGYSPDLGKVPITYYYNPTGKDNRFDIRAEPSLVAMIDAAAKDGIELKIVSGYRTYAYQESNFNDQVKSYLSKGYSSLAASSAAAQFVAPPGTSEHETGLAADIVNAGWYDSKHTSLTADFDQTAAFKWLNSHCADYGFILRYLKDKADVTKYSYEPWHYRYVGVNNAKNIMANGLCLEEYLKALGK